MDNKLLLRAGELALGEAAHGPDAEPTIPPSQPNWLFGLNSDGPIGFAERLNIIQPTDFDDEPTIPWGLCQPDRGYNIEDLPAWMCTLLDYLGE